MTNALIETSPENSPKKFPAQGREWLKTIFSVTVIWNVVAIYILFFYLKKIGWVELLQASIVTEKGIALIVIFLVITAVAMAFIFYSASYNLFVAATLFSDPKEMPAHPIGNVVGCHVLWLLILGAALWGSTLDETSTSTCHLVGLWFVEHLLCITLFYLALGAFVSIALFLKFGPRSDCLSAKKQWARHGAFGFLVAVSSVMSTLVVWLALEIQGAGLLEGVPWWTIYLVFVVTLPSIFIGGAALNIYKSTGSASKAFGTAGLVALIAFFCIFVVLPKYSMLPLSMAALRSVGVYSTDAATFQLKDVKQRAVYEDAGFNSKHRAGSDAVYFDAYVRYRFADVLLLCTKPYDPLHPGVGDRTAKPEGACIKSADGEMRRVQWD